MSYHILQYLKQKKLTRHFVNISSSSVYINLIDYVPAKLLDWDNGYFHSSNGAGQYFLLELLYTTPYIEKILIKTANHRDPYHWKIEGSKDGNTFLTLVDNTKGIRMCMWGRLNEYVDTTCIEETVNEFDILEKGHFKKIRFVHTGTDSNGENYLILHSIDFIGNIQMRFLNCHTFNIHYHPFLSVISLMIIINI